MDYWKNVPGLDEALTRQNAVDAVKKAIKAVDNIEFVAKKAGVGLSQSGISGMVDDILKKLKNVEYKVDSWFDGMKESSGMDSQYVQKGLEALIDDFKREPYEKHMVPVLKFVLSRLNQSFPDGDVTDADIQDLLSEPGARSALKKSKMSKFDVSDMVLNF